MLGPLITAACFAISGAALAQISPIAAEESNDGLRLIIKQQESLKADLDDGGIDGLTSRQNRPHWKNYRWTKRSASKTRSKA